MKQLIALMMFIVTVLPARSQPVHYQLNGTIKQVNPTGKITLRIRGKQHRATIHKDGTFAFSGTLSGAMEARLETKNAYPTFLWIDSGTITASVVEVPTRRFARLVITELQGSPDTKLYQHKILLPNDTIWGDPNNPNVIDSLQKISDARNQIRYTHFIDSLFAVRPTSNVLPHYIAFYVRFLSAENLGHFYSRLSASQQASQDGVFVAAHLTQKRSLQPGKHFDAFSLPDETGRLFHLDSIQSAYIFIDFWASWCGPCRVNHPYLRTANKLYGGKGLTIVSLSVDDSKRDWLKAIGQDSLSWTNVSDLKGLDGPVAKKAKLWAVPFSVLLDRDRNVIAYNLRGQELLVKMRRLLGGQ